MQHTAAYRLIWIGIGLLACRCPQPAVSQDDPELSDLSLFYLPQQVIYSVSKRPESYLTTPSAVHTITADEIRYSGAKKITDLFRMVPGIDVADGNAFQSGVQARGFSFFPKYARSMLVLVDGRTVYTPQINATFWDQIPLFLENIDRIEVIRGPNAALYGSNAFNGVINIITKPTTETGGGFASMAAGQRDSFWSVLRYGETGQKISYRITSGYQATKGFARTADDVTRPQVTLRADYRIDASRHVCLLAGYTGGTRQLYDDREPAVTSFFGQLKYEHTLSAQTRLQVQYYHDTRNSAMVGGHDDKVREDDIELQLNHDAERWQMVGGLGRRFDRIKHGYLSGQSGSASFMSSSRCPASRRPTSGATARMGCTCAPTTIRSTARSGTVPMPSRPICC